MDTCVHFVHLKPLCPVCVQRAGFLCQKNRPCKKPWCRKWHHTDDLEKQFPLKPPKGALSVFPSVGCHFQRLFAEGLIFCPLFYQEKSGIKFIINQ